MQKSLTTVLRSLIIQMKGEKIPIAKESQIIVDVIMQNKRDEFIVHPLLINFLFYSFLFSRFSCSHICEERYKSGIILIQIKRRAA